MYTMGMSAGKKKIGVNRCSFCVHAVVEHRVICLLALTGDDGCPRYEPVEHVSKRVEELMEKLPARYGLEH